MFSKTKSNQVFKQLLKVHTTGLLPHGVRLTQLAYNTFASFQINIILIFLGLVWDKKDLYLQIAVHIFTIVFFFPIFTESAPRLTLSIGCDVRGCISVFEHQLGLLGLETSGEEGLKKTLV